jgi:hypothetical protein
MSRHKRPGPRRADPARPARPAAGVPRPSRTLRIAGIAVVLLAAALLLWRGPLSRRPAAGADGPGRQDPRAAFAAGARLAGAGRHVESVPFFRRAAEGRETWESRFNLASALGNAALEVRLRSGREQPVMRSSLERVRAVDESQAEGARALELAPDAHARALTLFTRAQQYWAWGFPIDALELARAAREADPSWDAPARFVQRAERDLASGGATP